MDPSAHKIHDALQAVSQVRQRHLANPALASASADIKRFQGLRFRATYADLLVDARYKTAAGFFLNELYGDKDYAARDQQFARIANTIAKLFPQAVVTTAAALAEVHALTEHLDDLMAIQWLEQTPPDTLTQACSSYLTCWRAVADRSSRLKQLDVVMRLGQELEHLTGKPGLRILLKMMRRPASAAGLSSLQNFLESGFDAFAGMRGAEAFLSIIEDRETSWIACLFEDDAVACETKLVRLLSLGTGDAH